MSYLAIAKKAEENLRGERVLEVVEKETILAVKICSQLLQDDIWLILDSSFVPHDGFAGYFPEELALLKSKSVEDLRQIHGAKLAFPGCRVIQDGPERKGC